MSELIDKKKLLTEGAPLAEAGERLRNGIHEHLVILGHDGFVYSIKAETDGGKDKITIERKMRPGDYLRWVDELYSGGNLPSDSTGIHYRAAFKLREII